MTTIDEMTPAQRDAWVWQAKHDGQTWKTIAITCGFGWNGANMDGGRAKRAFNRHNKLVQAQLDVEVEVLDEQIEAEVERTIPTLEECAVQEPETIFDRIAALLEAGTSQRGTVNALEELGVTLNQVRKVAKAIKEGQAAA